MKLPVVCLAQKRNNVPAEDAQFTSKEIKFGTLRYDVFMVVVDLSNKWSNKNL